MKWTYLERKEYWKPTDHALALVIHRHWVGAKLNGRLVIITFVKNRLEVASKTVASSSVLAIEVENHGARIMFVGTITSKSTSPSSHSTSTTPKF